MLTEPDAHKLLYELCVRLWSRIDCGLTRGCNQRGRWRVSEVVYSAVKSVSRPGGVPAARLILIPLSRPNVLWPADAILDLELLSQEAGGRTVPTPETILGCSFGFDGTLWEGKTIGRGTVVEGSETEAKVGPSKAGVDVAACVRARARVGWIRARWAANRSAGRAGQPEDR